MNAGRAFFSGVVLASVVLVFESCATTKGAGSETNFVCSSDGDCARFGAGTRCVKSECVPANAPDQPRDAAPAGHDGPTPFRGDAKPDRTDIPPDGPATAPDRADIGPPQTPITQPENCVLSNSSTIPHVHVEFPSRTCVFSLQQARAGILFPYRIVVDDDVPGYIPSESSPQTGVIFYAGNSIANMRISIVLAGNGQRYCICDQGGPPPFCELDDGGFRHTEFGSKCSPVTVPKGTYEAAWPRMLFDDQLDHPWDGRNWSGPSDTRDPEGAPFPPGDYTLQLSIGGVLTGDGDAGTTPVGVDAKFLVRLVE